MIKTIYRFNKEQRFNFLLDSINVEYTKWGMEYKTIPFEYMDANGFFLLRGNIPKCQTIRYLKALLLQKNYKIITHTWGLVIHKHQIRPKAYQNLLNINKYG